MIEYEKILTKLVELKEKDDRIDDLFKWFLEAISPEQNSPYVEFNAVSWYMECLSILNKPLYEELTYFIYEAYNMKDWWSIETMEGKKYKIKTIEDMVDYLEKEF